jgi:hypothetical protein
MYTVKRLLRNKKKPSGLHGLKKYAVPRRLLSTRKISSGTEPNRHCMQFWYEAQWKSFVELKHVKIRLEVKQSTMKISCGVEAQWKSACRWSIAQWKSVVELKHPENQLGGEAKHNENQLWSWSTRKISFKLKHRKINFINRSTKNQF